MSPSKLCLTLLFLLFSPVASEADLFNVFSSSSAPSFDVLLADNTSTTSTTTTTTVLPAGVQEDTSVKLVRPGEAQLLVNGVDHKLAFEVVNNPSCLQRIFVCYPTSEINDKAKLGCPEDHCGFAVEFTQNIVQFMDNSVREIEREFFVNDKAIMQFPRTKIVNFVHPIESCNPKFGEQGYIKLLVLNATDDCYLVVQTAVTTNSEPTTTTTSSSTIITPTSSATTSQHALEPTKAPELSLTSEDPEASSAGFPTWATVLLSILGAAVLGGIIGSLIWVYIQKRKRKKATKATGKPLIVVPPCDESSLLDLNLKTAEAAKSKSMLLPKGSPRTARTPSKAPTVVEEEDREALFPPPRPTLNYYFCDEARSNWPDTAAFYEDDPNTNPKIEWEQISQNALLPEDFFDLLPNYESHYRVFKQGEENQIISEIKPNTAKVVPGTKNTYCYVMVRDLTNDENALFRKFGTRLAEPVNDPELFKVLKADDGGQPKADQKDDGIEKIKPPVKAVVVKMAILSHEPLILEFITEGVPEDFIREITKCNECFHPLYCPTANEASLALRGLPRGRHFLAQLGDAKKFEEASKVKAIFLINWGKEQKKMPIRSETGFYHRNTADIKPSENKLYPNKPASTDENTREKTNEDRRKKSEEPGSKDGKIVSLDDPNAKPRGNSQITATTQTSGVRTPSSVAPTQSSGPTQGTRD